jgi:transcriptional/translational regulatory protein YebC/TACO1
MGAQWKAKGKELAANAKGRVFGKLSKDIMIAARSGADPASNARLRLVVEQARKVSMPSRKGLDSQVRRFILNTLSTKALRHTACPSWSNA